MTGVCCSSPLAAQTAEQTKVQAKPTLEHHQKLKQRRAEYKERLAAKKAVKRQETVALIKKRAIKK